MKILTLGCSLDRITFVHFVEQTLDVPYRYFKNFKARIKINNNIKEIDVRYFVRKLDFKNESRFKKF